MSAKPANLRWSGSCPCRDPRMSRDARSCLFAFFLIMLFSPERQDPKAYVEALLGVYNKFSDVVNQPFRAELGFNASLDKVRMSASLLCSSNRLAENFATIMPLVRLQPNLLSFSPATVINYSRRAAVMSMVRPLKPP